MDKKKYYLNTALTAVLSGALLTAVAVRAFAPAVILPRLNIPNMVLISLLALVIDHYFAPNAPRSRICIPVFSGAAFGLLPLAAGFVGVPEALKLGLFGGIVFSVTAWLFTSLRDRLSSGPTGKAAAVLSGLGLYLAAQCLTGIGL